MTGEFIITVPGHLVERIERYLKMTDSKECWAMAYELRNRLAVPPEPIAKGIEYDIWRAAQLGPDEGIERAAERIRALLKKHGVEP